MSGLRLGYSSGWYSERRGKTAARRIPLGERVMRVSVGQSLNVPGLLEDAEARYRDGAERLTPATVEMRAQRAARLAEGVRLTLDEPRAMQRMHEVIGGLRGWSSLSGLLPGLLDGAMSLMAADFGNIQLIDPANSSLRIVTQSGFDTRFVDYFAVVSDDQSACGRALSECAQTAIADVDVDPDFAPHRGIAAASGFRAVQSTPLIDRAGRLIGVMSTHFERPHIPSVLEMQLIQLYADFAAESVTRYLGHPVGHGPGDILSRVFGLPHSETDRHSPYGTSGSRQRDSWLANSHGPAAAASSDHEIIEFADHLMSQLSSFSLTLDSARSIVGKGPAREPILLATEQLEQLVHYIRNAPFNADAKIARLSSAEREVLAMLAQGHRAADVASRLKLAPTVVRDRIRRTLDVLEVSSQIEAAALWEAHARPSFAASRGPGCSGSAGRVR